MTTDSVHRDEVCCKPHRQTDRQTAVQDQSTCKGRMHTHTHLVGPGRTGDGDSLVAEADTYTRNKRLGTYV
jgi:hypothetical protein